MRGLRMLKMNVKLRCAALWNFGRTTTGKTFLTFIPALVYLTLLLHHAFWDYFPDYWNALYNQPGYPTDPLAPPATKYSSDHLPNEMTVVTAYFNLGTFAKGEFKHFSQATYVEWMKSYSMLNNTVIAFTDMMEMKTLLENARKHFPEKMTLVKLINRNDFWSFRQSREIGEVFSQKGYPKHKPNTVNEYYSCAMHAKYDAVEYVIENKLYNTKYVAWIDIGYFRTKETEPFTLLPPDNLKKGHIAFTQIYPFYSYLTPKEIIYDNHVWIAGGYFIGQPEYLMPFIEDYRNSMKLLLSKNLMSTDQQVLYSMYVSAVEFKPRLPLQLFYHTCRCNWFFIGEVCRDTFDRQFRPSQSIKEYYLRYM